jgi:hypothetical protein
MHRYRNFYTNKNEKSWGGEEGREIQIKTR